MTQPPSSAVWIAGVAVLAAVIVVALFWPHGEAPVPARPSVDQAQEGWCGKSIQATDLPPPKLYDPNSGRPPEWTDVRFERNLVKCQILAIPRLPGYSTCLETAGAGRGWSAYAAFGEQRFPPVEFIKGQHVWQVVRLVDSSLWRVLSIDYFQVEDPTANLRYIATRQDVGCPPVK